MSCANRGHGSPVERPFVQLSQRVSGESSETENLLVQWFLFRLTRLRLFMRARHLWVGLIVVGLLPLSRRQTNSRRWSWPWWGYASLSIRHKCIQETRPIAVCRNEIRMQWSSAISKFNSVMSRDRSYPTQSLCAIILNLSCFEYFVIYRLAIISKVWLNIVSAK